MPREEPGFLSLVAADGSGRVIDLPGLAALGRAGEDLVPLRRRDCVPLPEGSELFTLPGRTPVGVDGSGEPSACEGLSAVAAFVAPAHTQLLAAAYRTEPGAPRLPLFAYTAVGWSRGRFWVPAVRIDPDRRQDHRQFDPGEVSRRARRLRRTHRGNRLWLHLLGCALCSGCPAARNLVLGRWEAPLPSSPACNARCLGCLSLQPPASGCPATQERIGFEPTVEEIAGVAVPHLESAPRAVASFGQGCEGEPLLAAGLVAGAVREIRRRTARGTLNLNTNASRPAALGRIIDAGLDSVRVSINSARPGLYHAYFRPRGYRFGDVAEAMLEVGRRGRFLSLNYFVFPGVTDDVAEWEALRGLLRKVRPRLIQWRNLNIDPDWYWDVARPHSSGRRLGLPALMARLRREFPAVRFGYYNPPLRGSRAYRGRT